MPHSCVVVPQPRPQWSSVPRPGTQGVEGRVLLQREGLLIANLRFQSRATIDRHSAPHDVDVVCMAGAGFTSIGDDVHPIGAGETVRWPAGIDHCLWTNGATMETIMVERYGVRPAAGKDDASP